MNARIRDYGPPDEQPVVELSLRAWASVFSYLDQGLGHEIFVRLHGDWRQYQDKEVRDTLAEYGRVPLVVEKRWAWLRWAC